MGGDLLAFLSADGRQIEVAELIMQVYIPPIESSFVVKHRVPIAFISVVLFLISGLLYYAKQKQTQTAKEGNSGEDSGNPDAADSKKKLGTTNSRPGRRL